MSMSNINIRIDSDKKARAQELFSSLGLDMSSAINIFIQQALDFQGIPFVIRKYNAETEEAMREAEQISEGKIISRKYSSATELFAELDSEED